MAIPTNRRRQTMSRPKIRTGRQIWLEYMKNNPEPSKTLCPNDYGLPELPCGGNCLECTSRANAKIYRWDRKEGRWIDVEADHA